MKVVVILFLLFAALLISCDKNDTVIPPKADFKIDSTILFINDTIQFQFTLNSSNFFKE